MEETLLLKSDKNRNGASAVFLLGVLLGLSVLLNVMLAKRISSLRVENRHLAESRELQVGSSVPPLTGHSVNGAPMAVRYEDARIPTVLYVFSPQCGWCAKNLENFRALIAQAGTSYQVFGLAMNRQDLDAYLSREHLTLPVFADVDPLVVSAYQLSGTPTTIVISPDRKVLKVWTGAYQEGLRQEVEDFLGVHLFPVS